ncbi:MAG: hypothetical protein A4E72_00390 [Syntrophus sp. PtaU1.Bin208]|nr:MAG: hypothetical protein A4E72_00390 [Syntrophus sp. PtaU1.Bin208]
MGLLNFIEEQHGIRRFPDILGQKAAFLITHIAGRGADQLGDRMLLLIFTHIIAMEWNPQRGRQLAGQLRLADPRRANQQEGADRFVRLAETGPRPFDRLHQLFDGRILAVDGAFQFDFQIPQLFNFRGGNILFRNAGDLGNDSFHVMLINHMADVIGGSLHIGDGPCLVEDIDGLVRKPPVIDEFSGEFCGRPQGCLRVIDMVILFVLFLQSFEDLKGLFNGRFRNFNLLKPPGQGAVFLKILSILIIGRRADAPELSVDKRRFEDVGGIHGAAGYRSRPYNVMDLIDKEDHIVQFVQFGQNTLHALFKITAESRSRQQ